MGLQIIIPQFLIVFILTAALSSNVFAGTHHVMRVIDGDTLIIDDGRRIQLLGVDAPEINDRLEWNHKQASRTQVEIQKIDAYGVKAKELIMDLLAEATIEVELDDLNFNTRSKDAYGRTLAYVYINIPENIFAKYSQSLPEIHQTLVYDANTKRLFLNASLIKSGYTFAYSRYPVSLMTYFKDLENEAKKNRRGLWVS